jgi:hypothetical protein
MLIMQSVQCILEHFVGIMSEQIIIYEPKIERIIFILPLNKHISIYFVTHYEVYRNVIFMKILHCIER